MLNGSQGPNAQKNWTGTIRVIALAVLLLAGATGLGMTFGWDLAGALMIAAAGWGAALFFRARQQRVQSEQQVLKSAQEQSERRLQAMLQLNQSLAEASSGMIDGRNLMGIALSTINKLVGALGSSFVPIDEWQQPLPAFTCGQLPDPVLNAWAVQLVNGMLRERCGNCKVLHSTPGACPLHPAQVGDRMTVYCVLQNGVDGSRPDGKSAPERSSESGQTVGVLHLYLPPGKTLDAETYQFLEGLLDQIGLAYQSTQLRQQEQVTLRQLHMLHAPEGDFSASLGVLLDGLIQALEIDFAVIRTSTPVRPQGPARARAQVEERLTPLDVQCGDFSSLINGQLDAMIEQAAAVALQGQETASQPEHLPAWLALPLALSFTPPGAPLVDEALPDGSQTGTGRGILLVGVNRPHEFHPRQRVILQAVAAQAALLVENEHMIRSLEYKIVIQERTRLAREIHDGLAQTLAFLKLQSAQMQSYLAQGDLSRLGHILQDNYQVLAEAYLDTRQAIDDLRLTPQDALEQWLEKILNEFENTTGLLVKRDIHPLNRPLAPEVQAQLIRIVQEALSNVRKHARANRVRVSLFERGGETILEVSDDGQGFAAEELPDISQHGLRGMRERARLLGADFQITSQALRGTTIRLVLPASIMEVLS